MRTLARLAPALLLALAPRAPAQGTPSTAAPSAPSPFELVFARPFVLDAPYAHTWRAEAPAVRSGWVLVLRAELERIRARQTLEPVLYVGAQTAERVNAPPDPEDVEVPGLLGQLVVVVPAPLDASGAVALDPWSVPIFLGTLAQPEDVDEPRIQRELLRAARLRLGPARRPAGAQAPGVPSAGPPPVPPAWHLADRHALDLELASLVERWSPEETDLVEMLRQPVDR